MLRLGVKLRCQGKVSELGIRVSVLGWDEMRKHLSLLTHNSLALSLAFNRWKPILMLVVNVVMWWYEAGSHLSEMGRLIWMGISKTNKKQTRAWSDVLWPDCLLGAQDCLVWAFRGTELCFRASPKPVIQSSAAQKNMWSEDSSLSLN